MPIDNQFRVAKFGGGGEIRTHGTLAGTLVFKTSVLNHSTTPPREIYPSLKTFIWKLLNALFFEEIRVSNPGTRCDPIYGSNRTDHL